MFAYIKGTVGPLSDSGAVVEANGIGYFLQVSGHTLSGLRTGAEVKMHTVFTVREDGVYLYGFLTREEMDMFSLLTAVTGVGPKIALNALSALRPSEITLAVFTDDIKTLSRAPGLGEKKAQRVVLELKSKLKLTNPDADAAVGAQQVFTPGGGARQDAIDALCVLGYGRAEAARAVLETDGNLTSEQMIKAALKKLTSR